MSSADFVNEPFTDFSLPIHRAAMEVALRDVRAQFGKTYFVVVDGKSIKAKKTFRSLNPSTIRETVGVAQDADVKLADRALASAVRHFDAWSKTPVEERAGLLRRMADLIRKRKFEFCAWLVYEVGKNWAEADADVAETIDFLNYYAFLALRPLPSLTRLAGETNEMRYLPLGPVVVISPWNFPLAIHVGMVSAALVTGNTVVAKPSNQSPIVAAKFVELAQQAGLPAGVLSFLTSQSVAVGEYLVKDPRTRMIAFTGSKAVGLQINERAARMAKGQKGIKRVIAEMGGKDAIIVDESAKLDAAAQAVFASAFGFQGQKCSACSRLYVHENVYGEFLSLLKERVAKIRLGSAESYENFMGPVISKMALKKIEHYKKLGLREGRLVMPLRDVPKEGYFVPPMMFERLPKNSKLWTEEIFGPVLAIDKFRTFEEALECVNDTDYALTGAVFSENPEHLAMARERFAAGNLYFNRKCTGALVGVHPFGGFHMSGTDSKAGGPDYLLLFTQAQLLSEKR